MKVEFRKHKANTYVQDIVYIQVMYREKQPVVCPISSKRGMAVLAHLLLSPPLFLPPTQPFKELWNHLGWKIVGKQL